MFKYIAIAVMFLVLTTTEGVLIYSTFFKTEKPQRQKIVETEIYRIDTVYISPPNAIKFDFGLIDTTWKGNDVGIKVLNASLKPEANFELIIVCIDGYQYYLSLNDASFTARVINGPNGMIAVPCKVK
jgi:hypothetical protein